MKNCSITFFVTVRFIVTFVPQVLCELFQSAPQRGNVPISGNISGFIRRLFLQLMLEDEKVSVFLQSPCPVSSWPFSPTLRLKTMWLSLNQVSMQSHTQSTKYFHCSVIVSVTTRGQLSLTQHKTHLVLVLGLDFQCNTSKVSMMDIFTAVTDVYFCPFTNNQCAYMCFYCHFEKKILKKRNKMPQ